MKQTNAIDKSKMDKDIAFLDEGTGKVMGMEALIEFEQLLRKQHTELARKFETHAQYAADLEKRYDIACKLISSLRKTVLEHEKAMAIPVREDEPLKEEEESEMPVAPPPTPRTRTLRKAKSMAFIGSKPPNELQAKVESANRTKLELLRQVRA